MKKIAALSFLCLSVAGVSLAQAYEGYYKTKKSQEPAMIVTAPLGADVMKTALLAKMADLRLRANFDNNNTAVLPGTTIPEIINTPLDYTFIINDQSYGAQKKSVMYLIMQATGNFTGNADSLAAHAKIFMNNMGLKARRCAVVAQIKTEEIQLAGAEEKLMALKNDPRRAAAVPAQENAVNKYRIALDNLKAQLH